MNIQEKIIELKSLYSFSKENHPELKEVYYTIGDVPLDELKTFASENNLKFEYNRWQEAVRTHVHIDNGFSIILLSRKVKANIPAEIQYEELVEV